MKLTESQSRILAWSISVALHVVILFIGFPDRSIKLEKTPKEFSVPVQLAMVAPPKPKPKPPQRKATPVRKQAIKTKAPAPKPTGPLPGDRDTPELSSSLVVITPKTALNNNWGGTVKARFAINTKGRPTSYKLLKSTGHDILDQAFIQQVMTRGVFKPKRVQGQNKPSHKTLSYTFEVDEWG